MFAQRFARRRTEQWRLPLRGTVTPRSARASLATNGASTSLQKNSPRYANLAPRLPERRTQCRFSDDLNPQPHARLRACLDCCIDGLSRHNLSHGPIRDALLPWIDTAMGAFLHFSGAVHRPQRKRTAPAMAALGALRGAREGRFEKYGTLFRLVIGVCPACGTRWI